MVNTTCPKSMNCPIFEGGVLQRATSEEVYKAIFCKAGKEKYEKCKRFIVSNLTNKTIPLNVMPNSSKTIEQIVSEMEVVS